MTRRFLWLWGLLALLILAASFSHVPAQRGPSVPFFGGGQVGRFVVAHASDKQIVILDTTSGKLYKATEKDFQKYSDLPKIEPMEIPLPFGGRDKDKGKEAPKDKELKDKDKAPPKDKEEMKKDEQELERKKEKEREEQLRREKEELDRKAEEAKKQALEELKRAEAAQRQALEEARRAKEDAERRAREKKKREDGQ